LISSVSSPALSVHPPALSYFLLTFLSLSDLPHLKFT
jgi:hypothetical protein